MNVNGYETKTTFWMDFSIAESFLRSEPTAIEDTYNRAFLHWKEDVVFMTELVMVLNWKCAYWYSKGNMALAKIYSDLWEELDGYCMDTLQGSDMDYFLATTD